MAARTERSRRWLPSQTCGVAACSLTRGRGAATSITLGVLHDVIQAAMVWFDYHLWEFTIGERRCDLPMDENRAGAPRNQAARSCPVARCN